MTAEMSPVELLRACAALRDQESTDGSLVPVRLVYKLAAWLECNAKLEPEDRESECAWCGDDHAAAVARVLLGVPDGR